MSTSDSCKDSALTKSNNDGVCELEEKLEKMSTADVSICANCGKEGANNTCNKCNQVKYCNAICKKVHKKKHKKDCEEHVRRAIDKHNEELRIAAEIRDEHLFKQPPSQYGDCPICFLCLPSIVSGRTYYACCGKMICRGCVYAPVYDNQGNEVDNKKCPFCRTPHHTSNEEMVKRMKKRMQAHDPIAIYNIGVYYRDGDYGYQQDYTKALELFHRAADGYTIAYASIGYVYDNGDGVEVDKEKANHYYELAAMGGVAGARHNVGLNEYYAGNIARALKHFMIAVRGGYSDSLNSIKRLYSNGLASKEDYTKALRSYQTYLSEIKSEQRDEAAANDYEEYRYC